MTVNILPKLPGLPMISSLTTLLDLTAARPSRLLARFGLGEDAGEDIVPALPAPRYEDHLSIPVRDATRDDRAARDAQARGQFLARQDRWDDLIAEIREADRARATTPGGVPVGELLAFGARSDVVLAAEHVLEDGRPADDTPLTRGVGALEQLRHDYAGDPYMALIVAQTHLDIAWAWRGAGSETQLTTLNREKCIAHFDRAAHILAPFSGVELNSPLIAAAQCALLAGREDAEERVADEYEDLIDLDPHNPRHMRALGNHLLPRWFGTHIRLAATAEDMAVNDSCDWGNRAYTWMWFDALRLDPGSAAVMEADRFIAGMHEILEINPAPHMANLMAAYAAGMSAATAPDDLSSEARKVRARIHAALPELLDAYLTELHPQVWARAHALPGSAHVGPLSHGRIAAAAAQARQAIDYAMRDRDEA